MRMNLRISIPDEDPQKNKLIKNITLKQSIEYVKRNILDEEMQNEVIKRISRYPANGFNFVIKNLNKIIQEIKKDMKEKN